MSHKMSGLVVYRIADEVLGYEGHVYLFPVAFFKRPDGNMTWRGEGQNVPLGKFAGIGLIGFVGDNDGSWGLADEWPLEIIPTFVQVDEDLFENWDEIQWDDHDVNWTANGHGRLVAAQYCRIRRYRCFTAYCTGPDQEEVVESRDAALAWLRDRQDPNHLANPDNVRYSDTGIWEKPSGELVADLTRCGCVNSDGGAVPMEG